MNLYLFMYLYIIHWVHILTRNAEMPDICPAALYESAEFSDRVSLTFSLKTDSEANTTLPILFSFLSYTPTAQLLTSLCWDMVDYNMYIIQRNMPEKKI